MILNGCNLHLAIHLPLQLAIQLPLHLAIQLPLHLAIQLPLHLAIQLPLHLAIQRQLIKIRIHSNRRHVKYHSKSESAESSILTNSFNHGMVN